MSRSWNKNLDYYHEGKYRAARAAEIGEEYNPPPHSNGGFVSDIVTHAPKLVLCCCLKTSHHIWLGSNFVQIWIDLEYLEYRLHATNQINNHTGVLGKVFSLYHMHHIYGQFRRRIGTNSNFFQKIRNEQLLKNLICGMHTTRLQNIRVLEIKQLPEEKNMLCHLSESYD